MNAEDLTDAEMFRLLGTRSETEWNQVCDAIKQARDGQYPPDWWSRMMLSGVAEEIMCSWKTKT